MARPVTMPPSKVSGIRVSLDLLEACDREVHERGITKRELFERALRKELGLPEPEDTDGQQTLETDLERRECA